MEAKEEGIFRSNNLIRIFIDQCSMYILYLYQYVNYEKTKSALKLGIPFLFVFV